MKKLFISCPMKDRTEEFIRRDMYRMHKMAEIVFDQKLEVIPTYIEHVPPETGNKSIYCLGESIKKMAEADYFIGITYSEKYMGCTIESDVADRYGIPCYRVPLSMFPDADEANKAYYETRYCHGNVLDSST